MLRNGPVHVPQLCEPLYIRLHSGGGRPAKPGSYLCVKCKNSTLLLFYAFTLYAFTLLFFYAFTLLLFYSFTLLRFYPFMLLPFYAFTFLLFYVFTLLLFYVFTLLRFYSCTLLRFYSFTLLRFYAFTARGCLRNTVSKDTPGATTGSLVQSFSLHGIPLAGTGLDSETFSALGGASVRIFATRKLHISKFQFQQDPNLGS